jgi:hypothetical protein
MDHPGRCLHELRTDTEPVNDHSSTPTDGWSGLVSACLLDRDPLPWSAPDGESLSFPLPQMASPTDGVAPATALNIHEVQEN